MLEFFTLKTEAFGLDISDSSLKIIKLKKKRRFFDLISFGEKRIKSGIIEKGRVKNEKVLTETIKEALVEVRGQKLKTKYVIASLPEEECFLQVIQLPKMKEEEVKKAVYFEAENYIPLSIEKTYLDSQIIPSVQGSPDHINVLIAALPKEIVDSYLNSLKGAGLQPLALEIEAQSICRALIKKESRLEPLLLIDFGESRTTFIIFSDSSLIFTSSCSVSSRSFTEAISKSLKTNLKDAEELKIKYGIDNNKEGKKNFEILSFLLIELVEQTKKYLNYYQTHSTSYSNKKIQKILLCGGGVNLKGFLEFLSLELGLQVDMGDPWTNILLESKKEASDFLCQKSLSYTTALGLALRNEKL